MYFHKPQPMADVTGKAIASHCALFGTQRLLALQEEGTVLAAKDFMMADCLGTTECDLWSGV